MRGLCRPLRVDDSGLEVSVGQRGIILGRYDLRLRCTRFAIKSAKLLTFGVTYAVRVVLPRSTGGVRACER